MILIACLVGVVLLVEKYRYNHAVWHFVLVAAVCHYVAILLAVVSELIKKMNYFK
jgi:hemolysin III